MDGARVAAQVAAEGWTIRSMSCLADGGIAVVLTQPAPTAAQVRRAQGGR